ncbi:unnamed protein product [Adineta steineri]|uniref:Uncharacterized protein n=2 Tax=Adineta steineri TaxID=433720 RepID=A0A819I6F4_9BILA|nr:unnamed protein product [Adineta steineri]
MPGGLYFYEAWETNEYYDLNVLVANVTIPGLVVDCLPIQTMFASTLECFYNQSCLNILLSAYQVNINISILNTSLSSRFTPTTTLNYLVNELFIEEIFNETIYGSYYQQCAPVYCSYTYSQRFDLVYVITTLIALFGGLNVTLLLIAPYLIGCLLFLKQKLFLQNEFQQNETPIPTFQNRFHNLVNKVKESIVQLNLFESHSNDAHRVYRERILTRLYLILMTSAMIVLIFYTFLSVQTMNKTITTPSEDQYKELQERYPDTLQCFCTEISISYGELIVIEPTYHQLCTSDFVQSWWYQNLIVEPDGEASLQIIPFSLYYPLIPNGTCSCARNPGCTTVAVSGDLESIDGSGLIELEGVHMGCFMTDAVSQSSLVCWYNGSCMEQLQTVFVSAGVTTFNNATKLNSSLDINFPPNTVVQTIIENVMADRWQSSASYTNFYQKCRPALCSYTYEERSSAIFIITTIIGLFGGLSIALRLISQFVTKIFFKFIYKNTTQEPSLALIGQEAIERKEMFIYH